MFGGEGRAAASGWSRDICRGSWKVRTMMLQTLNIIAIVIIKRLFLHPITSHLSMMIIDNNRETLAYAMSNLAGGLKLWPPPCKWKRFRCNMISGEVTVMSIGSYDDDNSDLWYRFYTHASAPVLTAIVISALISSTGSDPPLLRK